MRNTERESATVSRVIDGMSNGDYHRHPALGSTSLKTLATKSPAHHKWSLNHSDHKPQYDFGSAAHAWILEGDRDQIAVIRADNWLTKAAKEARTQARAEGKYPILAREFAYIRLMRLNVLDHPVARDMVTEPGTRVETSIFWEDDGMELKCRPDALNRHGIWDLKTTVSANPADFGRTAVRFGYHQSAAHYKAGVEAAGLGDQPFRFVLVEKEPPFAVSVVQLEPAAELLGGELNETAKATWRACAESNHWPAFPGMSTVDIPAYAYYDQEEEMSL